MSEEYIILNISGGGVRGITAVGVLKDLEDRISPKRIIESHDLIAGISTGALIALGLAAGYSASEILNFYKSYAKLVFRKSFSRWATSLNGLLRARYDIVGLKFALSQIFDKKLRMKDLNAQVLIPCFKLISESSDREGWRPVLINNHPGSEFENDLVIDVALRATAAPTYFPSYQGYIDGGVFASNPSLIATTYALDLGIEPSNIFLVYTGTGYTTNRVSGKDKDWGILQWAPRILKLIFDSERQISVKNAKSVVNSKQKLSSRRIYLPFE